MIESKHIIQRRMEGYECATHGLYGVGTPMAYGGTECPECNKAADAAERAWRKAHAIWKRWSESGIPVRYANRTFANFRDRSKAHTAMRNLVQTYAEVFHDFLQSGQGITIVGPVGTGKSHLAIAALTEVMRANYTGRFIAVTDLFGRMKRSFGTDSDDAERLLDELATTSLLVLDDLGAQRGTEWETTTLHSLLSRRYDEALPTIVTSNTTDLARYVGERIADRFAESMLMVELPGTSYRQEAANDPELRSAPLAIEKPEDTLEVVETSFGRTRMRKVKLMAGGEL